MPYIYFPKEITPAMKTQNPSSLEKLIAARKELNGERTALQTMGYAHTPEELGRIDVLYDAIVHIDTAIMLLSDGAPKMETQQIIRLKEGLYLAENNHLQGELRLDLSGSQIISMDIFRTTSSEKMYLASLRTSPGSILTEKQTQFAVICENQTGKVVTGILSLSPVSKEKTSVALTLDDALEGLPANSRMMLQAEWHNRYFRIIGLETEAEEGINKIGSYSWNGRQINIPCCFEEAGIKLEKIEGIDHIPANLQGWDDSQLHGLMTQFADGRVNTAGWMIHMLLLSKSIKNDLLGLMFDSGETDLNGYPRQGAAIFMNTFNASDPLFQMKAIKTAVHELGHTLNLLHRYERGIGRTDSTSFMNYDWLYMGGNHTVEYWQDFKFTFDPDEIRFMRHAPLWKLIPGGAEFATAKYWTEGGGGYVPYAPEVLITNLDLELSAPQDVTLFDFATPVFLQVKLTNLSETDVTLPHFILDPKAGLLEVIVKRISGSGEDENKQTFRPLVTRCYDLGEPEMKTLQPGQPMIDNLNLTYGCTGFAFAEPGNYEVTAIISTWQDGYNYIVRSNTLQVRIGYPKNVDEERDALKIFTREVGYYFVLGGSDLLSKAESELSEIREKRMKTHKVMDPLSAYITRCLAINRSRDFIHYKDKKFTTRKAIPAEANKLLNELKSSEKKVFDRATLDRTRKLRNATEERGKPEHLEAEEA